MTLSNHYNAFVLTTGNKSELATGYCTMYGDMCGAIAPIGDLFKTRVYELSRHVNAPRGQDADSRKLDHQAAVGGAEARTDGSRHASAV